MIKGRNRIIEKVKDMHQNFSKVVTTGTWSRSGKIVYEFFDKLFGEDLQTRNHFSLEFKVVIILIMESIMIKIGIMKNSLKMVNHQLIKIKIC